jgi:hypothetical protein
LCGSAAVPRRGLVVEGEGVVDPTLVTVLDAGGEIERVSSELRERAYEHMPVPVCKDKPVRRRRIRTSTRVATIGVSAAVLRLITFAGVQAIESVRGDHRRGRPDRRLPEQRDVRDTHGRPCPRGI